MVTLLIDGDGIAYSSAYKETQEDMEAAVEAAFHSILYDLEEKYNITANEYKIFIGGSNNFRKIVNPDYKANRKDKERPPLISEARKYLIKHHNAYIAHGCEADDSICSTWYDIMLSPFFEPEKDVVIICSPDKDFQSFPNLLFDTYHSRRELRSVNPFDADKFFYKQMAMGDASDGIKGIPKVGEKTAEKILAKATSTYGLIRATYSEYIKAFGRKSRKQWEMNYLMLKMRNDVSVPSEFEQIL